MSDLQYIKELLDTLDRGGYVTNAQVHRAKKEVEALPSSPLGRDADWALAMAEALGVNSGFSVPIVPSPDAFRTLFDQVGATTQAKRADVPEDVLRSAEALRENEYRGPFAWARKVIDWVAEQDTKPGRKGDAA